MKTKTVRGIPYFAFTKEEAKERGIEWKEDWRDAEKGDWALTDDGYIVLIRQVSVGKATGIKLVTSAWGTFNNYVRKSDGQPSYKMYVDHPDREKNSLTENANYKTPNNYQKKAILEMIKYTGSIKDAIRTVLPKETSERAVVRKFNQFIRVDNIFYDIGVAMSDYLKRNGIDEDYIIKQYKAMAETATSEKIRLEALGKLAELSGVERKKGIDPQKFQGFTSNQISDMKKTG
jgi:hypothetical protein